MTIETSQIHLFRVKDKSPVSASLLDGITEQQLLDWENVWQPEIKHAIVKLELAGGRKI
jgi:hypothetical protein